MCCGVLFHSLCLNLNCGLREDGTRAPYESVAMGKDFCDGRNASNFDQCKWYLAELAYIKTKFMWMWCPSYWVPDSEDEGYESEDEEVDSQPEEPNQEETNQEQHDQEELEWQDFEWQDPEWVEPYWDEPNWDNLP